MNKEQRKKAIEEVIENWVESRDPDAMGQLIRAGSFKDLSDEIKAMRGYSRSPKWATGIDEWCRKVEQACQYFAEANECERLYAWDNGYGCYSPITGRDYATKLKWALWGGAFAMPEV